MPSCWVNPTTSTRVAASTPTLLTRSSMPRERRAPDGAPLADAEVLMRLLSREGFAACSLQLRDWSRRLRTRP